MNGVDALVAAAIRLSERRNCSAGEISVATIARAAGMSRSTALRRLGGTRQALDDALRQRGLDPSRRPGVRVRAIEAGAELFREKGLEPTMAEIAERAGCSAESLYLTFGNRAGLLHAIFEEYSPRPTIEEFFAHDHGDLEATVREFYREILEYFSEQPQVVPNFFAHTVSNPTEAAQALFSFGSPEIVAAIGSWLSKEIAAGTIKPLPIVILIQQLVTPIMFHLMMRNGIQGAIPGILPEPEEAVEHLADLFLAAVHPMPAPQVRA